MSISSPGSGDGGPENAAEGFSSDHFLAAVPQECNELPLLDPAILDDLEKQIGDPETAQRFARDYARMWVRRQRTLTDAVERQDHEAALDAVLSLKNSSAMVGGVRLARLVETLEKAIRTEEALDSRRALLDMVSQHGAATVRELQHGYLSKDRF